MNDDLRTEVDALRARVAELEARLDGADASAATDTTASGLDHRDETVLEIMRDSGRRSKRRLVDLYISATDIQDRSTAKRRAKTLEQTDVYQNL